MSTQRCTQYVSPAGATPERITNRSHVSIACNPSMNDGKMAEIMNTIRTTDMWNMNPTASRPGPSFCKEDDAVDVLGTDEAEIFIIDPVM